jgi:D-sedoheptulose 7-phosphate isomerase
MFDARQYFDSELTDHRAVAEQVHETLGDDFLRMLACWKQTISQGGKILLFGNGGSASDAQHMATELTVRYKKNRAPIAALALNTDTSALTAIGNDLGFDEMFSRQIAALGNPGDLVVAISTSGRSPNIIAGLKEARRMGLTATALGGRDGGDMVGLADPLIIAPSDVTARIQEMHITILHILCGALELELGLVEP